MVAAGTQSAATRAITCVIDALASVGLSASRDAGAFHPQPTGILVGLPALTSRGLVFHTFTIPVHIVSGVPLNTMGAVDALYAIADAAVAALGEDSYVPSEWGGGPNLDPLPSLLLSCVVTISPEET
jgi:hypothetical protein